MKGVINLSLLQMFFAYLLVIAVMGIIKLRGVSREKELLVASIRMTFQLMLTGYVLVYLFESMNPFYTILVIFIMEVFAIYNIYQRAKMNLSKKIKEIIALSMAIGTLSSIVYFLLIVVNVSPWYDPRYFIPISGMLIGNSMTGITLGVTRLVDGMRSKKHFVETALMLGATPKKASKSIVDDAFDSAILPTINSMVGIGIIFLPGMMTGQILSGTSPITAIKYQMAIMLGILGSVAFTTILFVQLGYRTFFNDQDQLIDPNEDH